MLIAKSNIDSVLYDLIPNTKASIGVISAFTVPYENEQLNLNRMTLMQGRLLELGCDIAAIVDGIWKDVFAEKSFVVRNPDRNVLLMIAAEFDQEAIIIKDGESNAYLVYTNGTLIEASGYSCSATRVGYDKQKLFFKYIFGDDIVNA